MARRSSSSGEGRETELVAKLELRSGLEALAEQDLQHTGLEVIRMKLEDGSNYNFFNGEFVTGKDGKTYFLTNGTTDEKAKAAFEKLLVQELEVVAGVYFTPAGAARPSLAEQGGVGCRAKGGPFQGT